MQEETIDSNGSDVLPKTFVCGRSSFEPNELAVVRISADVVGTVADSIYTMKVSTSSNGCCHERGVHEEIR